MFCFKYIDDGVFLNPSKYDCCSPGILVLISIVMNGISCVVALGLWCVDEEFYFASVEAYVSPSLRNKIVGGCLDPKKGSKYINTWFYEITVILRDNDLLLDKNYSFPDITSTNGRHHRQYYYYGWASHLLLEMFALFVGFVFFYVGMLSPFRKRCGPDCEGYFLQTIAVFRTLCSVVGLVAYYITWYGIAPSARMEMNRMFDSGTKFWNGLYSGSLAICFDLVGIGLMNSKLRNDRVRLGEWREERTSAEIRASFMKSRLSLVTVKAKEDASGLTAEGEREEGGKEANVHYGLMPPEYNDNRRSRARRTWEQVQRRQEQQLQQQLRKDRSWERLRRSSLFDDNRTPRSYRLGYVRPPARFHRLDGVGSTIDSRTFDYV